MSDEARQKVLKKGAAHFLYQFTRQYAIDPNPLTAWKAYRLCHDFGLEIPKWVREYFDRVTLDLIKLPQDKQRVESQIHRALKVTGNPHIREGRFLEQLRLSREVAERTREEKFQADGKVKWDAIFNEVADKNKISRSTVQRAFEKCWPYFQKL